MGFERRTKAETRRRTTVLRMQEIESYAHSITYIHEP
jgi:hypothetical protein